MRALTAAQMRAADAAGVARLGEIALMRAAGAALAEAIDRIAPQAHRLVAFAGPGNNGGDAYAAFAGIRRDCERIVYALPSPNTSDGRRDAEKRAAKRGVKTRPYPQSADEARRALERADVALDALLGTGARAELSAEMLLATRALNASDAPVLAVDIPTGVDATTGAAGEGAVRAHATVTLGALKLGLLLEPARGYVGALYVGDIGLGDEIASVAGDAYRALDDVEFGTLLPARASQADKRSSGATLVVAGSAQFPGAAVLCAHGAARAGAGYVTVAAGADAAQTLRNHLVEQVVVAYDEGDVDGSIAALLDLTKRQSAVGIGPGLPLSDATGAILRGFLHALELPFVADASAFFHLAKHLDVLKGKACVLTPHETEFGRLSGKGTVKPGTRIERLREFVQRTGLTTLLKGNATLVADGREIHVNVTGSNALATAGTGDVLTGIIATLLGQGLSPVDAARAGAYWHGLAGRHAANERRIGVVASDVYDALGASLPKADAHTSRLQLVSAAP
ncbi:MAG: NAD(P)H-hydrate dehydratase [Candidatus Eremiobacteraeota bacterium]|nr:NAD(P)H-hydrate dehydratase [Candidatus Eremiobacteraeota bacterium]